ncbi:MAG TPA: hypothetical protein VIF81_10810 [Pyrinomonadaceae bacterium]
MTKTPSVMAGTCDVKQALRLLDASENRMIAFKSFDVSQLGHYG